MGMSILGQAATFLVTFATGFALGIFYDIFRVIRRVFRPRFVGTMIFDLLFWLVSVAVLFLVLLFVNFAEIRFFVFLGMFLGLIVHFVTLSRAFLALANFAKKSLRKSAKYVKMESTKLASEVVHLETRA
ncbi:MAG: spore cortex biosynthesis protein YabQ [Defluviitaleaceae bacterium]|nr:spore cortex biosynthesis protein YabQ [Defluviitaleaceae bacterium]